MKTLRDIENKINPDNPFEDCKLEREKYADNLTRIIENYPTGFVMALNNRWGDGKTYFVNRWRQKLKNEGFQVVYYNAWEDDYSENALVSIIGEITEDIGSTDTKLLDKVLEKGTGLFVKSLPILLKIAVEKLTGKDRYEDLANLIGEEMGKPFQSLIEEYKNQKKTVVGFREALKDFAENVGKGKPIIFFIDELDRCKPSYAVEVLEIIKHLFSVNNIVFVLSVDKEQLANSVKGYYGSDQIDGNEYLKRFIDLEFSLPKPTLKLFFEATYKELSFETYFHNIRNNNRENINENRDFESFSINFYSNKNLNLRQIKRLMAQVRTVLYSFEEYQYTIPTIVVFLIYLKSEKIKYFQKIKNKEINLIEVLRINKELTYIESSALKNQIPAVLKYNEVLLYFLYSNYLGDDLTYNKLNITEKDFEKNFKDVSIDQKYLYNKLISKNQSTSEIEQSLEYLLNKIELSDNLKFNN